MATHSGVLAWRIPGNGGAWWAAVYGVAQSGHDRSDLAAAAAAFLPWWPTQSGGSWSLVGPGSKQQRRLSEENFVSTPSAGARLGAEAGAGQHRGAADIVFRVSAPFAHSLGPWHSLSYLPEKILIIDCLHVAQVCTTLSDPMDCSLPGSFVHGTFQARVLEWVAIAFSAIYMH